VKTGQAWLNLSLADQDVFSAFNKTIIFPVPNKWGRQGWTLVDLKKVHKAMLTDVLTTAYSEVAPVRLRAQIRLRSAE
jgi:hypothetical protein